MNRTKTTRIPPLQGHHDAYPHEHGPQLSRRRFLTTLGMGALATTPIALVPTGASPQTPLWSDRSRADLWGMVTSSALFTQLATEWGPYGFVLTDQPPALRRGTRHQHLLGLIAQYAHPAGPRRGGTVILTIDVVTHTLQALHAILAWERATALELASVVLTRHTCHPQALHLRGTTCYGATRRLAHHMSFPRIVPARSALHDGAHRGTGSANPDHTDTWHYGGCSTVGWTNYRDEFIQYGTQVVEYPAHAPTQWRVLALPRWDGQTIEASRGGDHATPWSPPVE